ncbi:MAG TPA: ABC transporter ATP-binding protein, partial [Pseudothauera hydrothermalis]|nr:ABC transporter ATP-binding protein [Pseudothauera hydrothermalis]
MLFEWFERRVDPYPEAPPRPAPRGFFAFLWAATEGMRPYILGMMLLTAAIGVFEALLFAMLGRVVDWLAAVEPARLWAEEGARLSMLAGLILGSIVLVALQTMLKHQSLAGNFPMRLRWNYHRLLLGQSMSFFQDEFAGRVSAKVMQTALAVRDSCLIMTDILVFVVIYFVTMVAVVGGFDLWLMLPFLGWLVLYVPALRWFVPRLAKVSRAQADARALMTGRITDAYTNIATVKLFSHAGREAGYARAAMKEFMHTVHGQMRLVS